MIGRGIVFRDFTQGMTLLSGKVTQLGIPVSRQVKVYSRSTGALLTSTRSDEDGSYKLYVPLGSAYTIVSIDSHKKFNAVIQDNVVPK